jgi:aspartyl-tRNA synthetase
VGERVRVAGWVHRRRDHGGLIFIDLRDRTGLLQLVFNPDRDGAAYRLADSVRSEYVVSCEGQVSRRPEGRVNPNMASGAVEVMADAMEVLNPSKTPPIYIEDDLDVDEMVRLKYRYLDLRRPVMYDSMALRHRATMATRNFLDGQGFLEIETPMLTKSTPEGARDYIVPSRVNPGEWYALPQSPQLFKQLLMVSGMERYFQIVRCFRDEDLRADRQPEFTQIDIEMSFVERDDVLALTEALICHVYDKALGIRIERPFVRIDYDTAIARYGSEKPDLRFGMAIEDLSAGLSQSGFRVFYDAITSGGTVRGINAVGSAHLTRKDLDGLTEKAKSLGARGLLWAALSGGEIRSSFAKFVSDAELQHIRGTLDAKDGDLMLLVAGPAREASVVLGALRLEIGRRSGLMAPDSTATCWVTDFPLFELDGQGNLTSSHHPFTSPSDMDLDKLESSTLAVKSNSYDLVMNGYEIGGGSIRICSRAVQERVFKTLGLPEAEVKEKFGFLLEAFEFGAPPHGGIALGLDRLVMVMGGRETIRDVIAFPKTTSASDLMTGAPSRVTQEKLDELRLKSIL